MSSSGGVSGRAAGPLTIRLDDAQRVLEAWHDNLKLANELTQLLRVVMHEWEPNEGSKLRLVEGFKGWWHCCESQGTYRLGSAPGGPKITAKREAFLRKTEAKEVLDSSGSSKEGAEHCALLFSPMGTQARQGRQLYESNQCNAFNSSINDCYACYQRITLAQITHADFLSAVFGEGEILAQEELVWMFVLQYALWKAVAAAGVSPGIVLGHSNGEYAAAVAAGIWSMEEAMYILIKRAGALAFANGSMASLKCNETDVREALKHFRGEVVVAAVNSPYDTVVSGPSAEVQEFCSQMNQFTISCGPFNLRAALTWDQRGQVVNIRREEAVDLWNREHHTCTVLKGDRIVRVDGKDFTNSWEGTANSITLLRGSPIKSSQLKVPAMHSKLVSGAKAAVHKAAEECLGEQQPNHHPRLRMMSSLTAEILEKPDALYWSSHDDQQPIHFLRAMRKLREHGCKKFLELGSDGKLLSLGKRCIGTSGLWLPALRPDHELGEVGALKEAIASFSGSLAACHGAPGHKSAGSRKHWDSILREVLNNADLSENCQLTLHQLGLDSLRVERLHNLLKKDGWHSDMKLGRN